MYGPSARMRLEEEEEQRSSSAVVITSILSLLVVVAAVAIVAWLVLRSPASAVDSAERLEPVGTAISAPTEQPALPTPLPTEPPVATEESAELPEAADNQTQQEAPEEPPAVVGLPTVVTEELEEPAGPTPTPRVIAQPTEIPPTPVPAAPTLPPAIPVTEVPVVALQPVEQAPPIATVAPAQDRDRDQGQAPAITQPTPVPAANDDDPFNIFDEVDIPRIDPAQDPMERVREMQENNDNDSGVNQVIVPSNGNGNGNGQDENNRSGRDREERTGCSPAASSVAMWSLLWVGESSAIWRDSWPQPFCAGSAWSRCQRVSSPLSIAASAAKLASTTLPART